MALYEIQTSDGSTYHIEGADDLTQQELEQAVAQSLAPNAGAGRGFVNNESGTTPDTYVSPDAALERLSKGAGVPSDVLRSAIDKARTDAFAFAEKNKLPSDRANNHFASIADIYIDDAINKWKLDNQGVGATLSGMSLSDIPNMVKSGVVGLTRGVNELIGNEYDSQLAANEQQRLQSEYSNALRNDLSMSAGAIKSAGESGTQMLLTAPIGGLVGAGAKAALGATRLGAAAEASAAIAGSVGAKAPILARAINAAPSVAGAAAMETTLGGSQGASQAADDFDNLLKSRPDLIRSSEAYKSALEETGSDSAAMDMIRREAVLRGGGYTALASMLTAPIGGGALEGFMLRRLAGQKLGEKTIGGALRETLKVGAAETGQEFVQSGAESIAGDIAQKQYNPEAEIDTDKALVEASMGGIVGGMMAGPSSAAVNLSDVYFDHRQQKRDAIAAEKAKLDLLSQKQKEAKDLESQTEQAISDAAAGEIPKATSTDDAVTAFNAATRNNTDVAKQVLNASGVDTSIASVDINTLRQDIESQLQELDQDPVNRLAELEKISKGTPDQEVTLPDGRKAIVPGTPGRYFTDEEKAEYDSLKAANGAAVRHNITADAGSAASPFTSIAGETSPIKATQTVGELRNEARDTQALIDALNGVSQGLGDNVRGRADISLSDPKVGEVVGAIDQLGRITQVAFGFTPRVVGGINGYGLNNGGTVFLNAEAIATLPKKVAPRVVLVHAVGHEGFHSLETSKDEGDRQAATVLKEVVAQYAKPGVIQGRQMAEESAAKAEGSRVAANIGLREVAADVSGSMWLDSKFWGMVYDKDPNAFRRIAYSFMRAATKFLQVAKGSRFDINTMIVEEGIEAVREAAATAWAQRGNKTKSRTQIKQELFSAPSYSRTGETNEVFPGRNGSVPADAGQDRPTVAGDGGDRPNYGQPREGAVSIIGRHYSKGQRTTLSGLFYGQGLKGAEANRLEGASSQIRSRVYFYVDTGKGIRPESGVGGYAHEVRLDNIYDPATRLVQHPGDANGFEEAVVKAGFDGYLIKDFTTTNGAVVLLGTKHGAVPVRYVQDASVASAPVSEAPSTIKKSLLSKEANAVNVDAIPGAKMRMGTLEVPVDQRDAANAEMERIGSDVRYSRATEAANLEAALDLAKGKVWRKGRDLKVAIQQSVIDAAARDGIDPSIDSPETRKYLLEVGLRDGLFALKQNPNAIGWYDLKTRQALAVMSLVHPEIAKDENAKLAFVWAMAVTSNGLKVGLNFQLAERVYESFKKIGRMPSNMGIGTAKGAIDDSLALFNKLREELGIDNLRQFMQTDFTVSEITGIAKDLKPGGEHADVVVKGASILGPKIGNGFFSNLYGNFGSLTMDRWLIRTWGRWTGTLIKAMPEQTADARARLSAVLAKIAGNENEAARLSSAINTEITADMSVDDLAVAVQKASMKPDIRTEMNKTADGVELRKAGNGLAKYLDGQKEAPQGPTERKMIRAVFGDILTQLRNEEAYKDLTMADLQAVLWYAEKRLYESAKDDVTDDDVDGYSDEDAPDYANAAADVAASKGISDRKIQNILRREKDGRTGTARLRDEPTQEAGAGKQAASGGFTRQEKRRFIGERAILRTRANRTGDAGSSGSYARDGGANVRGFRVLKSLGVSYTDQWKIGKDAATVFRANEIAAPVFYELVKNEANAAKFREAIAASKKQEFGAAVYVYDTADYQQMRLFLTDDGKSGVAVKPDGDIVSVFSTVGAGRAVMELAVSAGGRKLDAFNTMLPQYYAAHGFRAVARTKWNDEFAPEGWSKQTFAQFQNGEPDVVFMVYDPSKQDAEYSSKDGKTFTGPDAYDKAVAAQTREVKRIAKSTNQPIGNLPYSRAQEDTPVYSRSSLDAYMDGRNKSMPTISSASEQERDIALAVKAINAASTEITTGNRDVLQIPIGRVPHAASVAMPSRKLQKMMHIETSILKKVLFDKHSEDFAGVDAETFVRALYQPAMILKGRTEKEFEIVTNLVTKKGPILVPVTDAGNSFAIMSAYAKNVGGGGESLVKRIKSGALLYADPELAQIAVTGRSSTNGINTRGAQFPDAPPLGANNANVSDKDLAVKPLNPYYVGWAQLREDILGGIRERKVKTDLDVMKRIGKLYKGDVEDAPSYSRSRLGYYSALERGLESLTTKTAPAKAWQDAIKGLVNKGTAKADEVEWSGINDWLALQDGKVTKQQILDYLKSDGVKVEEVVLGRSYNDDGSEKWDYEGEAKYSQYTLPGGENYREVLLTLPTKNNVAGISPVQAARVLFGKEYSQLTEGQQDEVMRRINDEETPAPYMSSHWQQPNVLAHIRVNDRADADGAKTLFVEELQSDWGQGGKKGGFSYRAPSKVQEEVDSAKARIEEITQEIQGGVSDDRYAELSAERRSIGNSLPALLSELDKAKFTGVPAAPFVTKTEGWLNLALKRIITMAVEGGYEKVAFVNGQQSADRYDLSKQVDKIVWNEKTGDLAAQRSGGDTGTIKHQGVTKDKLADLIGKDPAERLINAKEFSGWRSIEGDDLKVGGEGMKTFYDSIVPQAVKKLIGKMDGKLEMVKFGSTARSYDEISEMLGDYDAYPVGSPEREALKREMDSAPDTGRSEFGGSQPGFTITPKMQEQVDSGLPLFSRSEESTPVMRESQISSPEFKRWSNGAPVIRLGEKHEFKSGQSVVVEALHGTTNSDLTEFKRERANIESDWGAGFYASNTPDDVAANYANNDGADLTQRIELMAERLASNEFDDDMDAAREEAKRRLTQESPNTLKLYVRMSNPAVQGGKGETFFDYTEEYDEETDSYAEPTGKLVDFVESLRNVASDFNDADADQAMAGVWDKVNDDGGIGLSDLVELLKESDSVAYAVDDDGNNASGELIRRALEDMGFDGVIDTTVAGKFKNMKGMNKDTVHFIAFDPTQLKSATGNNGNFDPTNPDIRYSRAEVGSQPIQGNRFNIKGESFLGRQRRKYQDSFIQVKRVQDQVVKQGGRISEATDVYRAEERSHGIVEEALKDFRLNHFDPMIEDVQKAGLTPDELALFAYAKHAPERNAYIAKINKGMPDGGSGMTNQEAADIIQAFTTEGKLADLERLHGQLLDITRANRLEMLGRGLITQDQFDTWEGMFQNYVPLRTAEEDVDQPIRRGGRGFSVRGKESMRAMGRATRAGDILENIFNDYERTVNRAERNDVGLRFLQFVLDNPDSRLWEIDKRMTKQVWDSMAGKVKLSTKIDTSGTVAVKMDGKPVYIKVHDPLLLRAMNAESDAELTGARKMVSVMASFNSMLRASLTQYNPIFAFTNYARDFGMGLVSSVDSLGYIGSAKYAKYHTMAWGAANRFVNGKLDLSKQMDKRFEEYRLSGATTGGFYAKDVEQVRQEIRNVLLAAGAKPEGWVENVKTIGGTTTLGIKGVRALGNVLEHMGSVSENVTRFAAFAAARDDGKSVAEAASIAKNLTTNFNRKGEYGAILNSAYLFFNASVQGSAQVLKTMKNPKVWAGMLPMMAAAGFLLAGAGGEDDDGQAYWDKIPDYEKERNLIIMLPDYIDVPGVDRIGTRGKYIKIPMAYGFNTFVNLGTNMKDVLRNKANPQAGIKMEEAAKRMVSSVMGSFNPVGGSIDLNNPSSVVQAALPTLFDVIYQQASGVDSFSRGTSPKKRDDDTKPDSENVTVKQAGSATHKLARWLNGVTGGDKVTKGLIDVAPGSIDNLINSGTGGVGRFIGDVANLIAKKNTDGVDVTVKDVPLLKNFFGEVNDVNNTSLMYERIRQAKEAHDQVRDNIKLSTNSENIGQEQYVLAGVYKASTAYTKALRQIRIQEFQIADSDASDTEKRVRLNELRKQREGLAVSFNQMFMSSTRVQDSDVRK